MAMTTTAKARTRIRPGWVMAQTGCYAGAIGITIAFTCVWLIAKAIMGTATTDLGVCQDRLNYL